MKLISAIALTLAASIGLSVPADAAPSRELRVHTASYDTNGDGGSWAWADGRTLYAAAPSLAYSKLEAWADGYPRTLSDGTYVQDNSKYLFLKAGSLAGRYLFVCEAAQGRPASRGGDVYVRVVLFNDGAKRVFYMQRV